MADLEYPGRFDWLPGDRNPPKIVFGSPVAADFPQLRALCSRLRRIHGDAPSVKTLTRAIAVTGWTMHVARVNSSTIVGFVLVESVWREDGYSRLAGFWAHPEILRPADARYLLQLALLENPAAPLVAYFAPENPAVQTLISNGWKNVGTDDKGRVELRTKSAYRARRSAE